MVKISSKLGLIKKHKMAQDTERCREMSNYWWCAWEGVKHVNNDSNKIFVPSSTAESIMSKVWIDHVEIMKCHCTLQTLSTSNELLIKNQE